MSFAKGLAWSLRVPCLGVCSFTAAAAVYLWQNPASDRVLVVGDARRDELFCAAYQRGECQDPAGIGVSELHGPQIVPRGQLSSLPAWSAGAAVVAIQGGILLPEGEPQPCGEIAVGILLRTPGQAVSFSVSELAALEPQYLRAVAAKTIAERTGSPRGGS
jgi:tRNA A37 threonylcarbamoyladenosine modification protein TsaB